MSVGGVHNGSIGPRDLEGIEGTPTERADRDTLRSEHSGISGAICKIFSPFHLAVVPRKSIDDLPAFTVQAKDGSHLDVDLVENRFNDDRLDRPATCFSLAPSGNQPRTEAAFFVSPGHPTEVDLDAGKYGGDGAAPMSLRHTLLAREALDKMAPYLKAAAASGAPLKPGAEAHEISAARQMFSGIEAELKALESVLARSPETKLAAETFERLVRRTFNKDVEFDKAIADLEAALKTVGTRTALTSEERALAESEIGQVLFITEYWRGYSGRNKPSPQDFPVNMTPGRT